MHVCLIWFQCQYNWRSLWAIVIFNDAFPFQFLHKCKDYSAIMWSILWLLATNGFYLPRVDV